MWCYLGFLWGVLLGFGFVNLCDVVYLMWVCLVIIIGRWVLVILWIIYVWDDNVDGDVDFFVL